MPKAIKGNAGKTPPEPSAGHADIDGWITRQMPHLQPMLTQLDGSIRSVVPDLQFAVKWKRPFYGRPELLGWIEEAGRTTGWTKGPGRRPRRRYTNSKLSDP